MSLSSANLTHLIAAAVLLLAAAWQGKELLRAVYAAADQAAVHAGAVLPLVRRCPDHRAVPAGLHRARLADRDPGLAPTAGCSNGPTEAINLLIKNVKRVGYGFCNFANYRLRLLLHCGVTWQTHRTARMRSRHPRLVA